MAIFEKFDQFLDMRELDELKESREYEISRKLEDALNDTCFDRIKFAKTLQMWHPTLQQNFYGLIQAVICWMASDKNHFIDGRNRASHENAKEIAEIVSGQGVPFI